VGEYSEFRRKHPDIDIGLLEDAFEKCQGKAPKSIQEAYEHTQNCSWCQKYIENFKRAEKLGLFISKVAFWQVGRY